MRKHAPRPDMERYSLCGITHEGNEHLPAEFALTGKSVSCHACRIILDFCKAFDAPAQQKKVKQ